MKITNRKLRKLIEAFIGQQGAPPIKIRTDVSQGLNPYAIPKRKVSTTLTPESLDAILDRFITDYDTIKQLPQKPAAPGQRSEQYQAMLDRGYNMKIEDFLNYGGRLQKLAMSDDEETQRQALNIGASLGFFSMGIEDPDTGEYIGLTGEDLVDAEEAGQQLLNDPKFAAIGAVAVREDEEKESDIKHITYLLNSEDPKERSLGANMLSGALKNVNFIRQFARKIDTAFKNALPHIKESILDEISYQVYAYGNDYRFTDPFEGEDIDEFVEENQYAIMGTLGSFTGFQEIDAAFDAGLNESNVLVNYFDVLTLKSIKRSIEELIEAGLLEKIPETNKFKMTKEVYEKRQNQQSGRTEDYYKQAGLRLKPEHQHYVPNPNLPAITKEGKMKITRKQLKRLIAEAAGRRIARPMYFTTDDKYWRIEIAQDRGRYYWYLYVISPNAYGGAGYRPQELMYYDIIDDSKTHKPGYYYSLADCIEHMAHVFESDPIVNYDTLSAEKPTSGLRKLVEDMRYQMRGGQGPLMEKKKRKKKKTKSKKRGYLYPYVYGHHDHDFHDYGYDVGDSGFDGGGDGGGGE